MVAMTCVNINIMWVLRRCTACDKEMPLTCIPQAMPKLGIYIHAQRSAGAFFFLRQTVKLLDISRTGPYKDSVVLNTKSFCIKQ